MYACTNLQFFTLSISGLKIETNRDGIIKFDPIYELPKQNYQPYSNEIFYNFK